MALDLPSYLLGKKKGGGGGGTSDYSQLTNKPSINGVTLSGNKTGEELGVQDIIYLTINDTSVDTIAKLEKEIDSHIDSGFYICLINANGTSDGHLLFSVIKTTYSSFEFRLNGDRNVNSWHNFVQVSGSWNDNHYTVSNISYRSDRIGSFYITTDNSNAYNPTNDYSPATKKYVDDNANPVVTTDTTSTSVSKSSVSKNQVWKYGTLSSLSFGGVKNFDKETIFYFTSGSPGTNISLPTDLVNLGDVPTLTLVSNMNTGTCDTNKNYIIAICNKIAVWKKY